MTTTTKTLTDLSNQISSALARGQSDRAHALVDAADAVLAAHPRVRDAARWAALLVAWDIQARG